MENIGIIIGGESVEHEVSIVTGLQIFDNIDKSKYKPYIIYITKDGKWLTGEILRDINTYKKKEFTYTVERIPWKSTKKNTMALISREKKGMFSKKQDDIEIDVVIPATHGTGVEDGTLQGILENIGVPYAFSDVKASALGMDKIIMKKVFKDEGLPLVDYRWFYKSEFIEDRAKVLKEAEKLGYPLIVKPSNLGSSIGITKATNQKQLEESIEVAISYDKKIIVEKCLVNAREINCGVLGYEKNLKISKCEEPIGWKEFLKYEDKYVNNSKNKGDTKRVIPADIPESITNEIMDFAKRSFISINASGAARVDFLLEGENVYVNEINTIPGSVSFYLWEPSGIEFKELIDELINIAKKKLDTDLIKTYDVDLLNKMASSTGAKRE
ncbi:MAG: D-alanine--D-alanine ligase family protein [Bacillota bacterium]|nr:D-alanine--D-alanine ligase family protein [Bacillota bacterium]